MEHVFAELAALLRAHGDGLVAVRDSATELRLDEPGGTMFAAVSCKKSYVSLHLLPLYRNPALLERVPPGLRARMQGKACFNFKRVDQVDAGAVGTLLREARPS